MSKRKAKEPSYIVPALERGLLLLQAFSKDKPVQSLGILAKELDLPRATTFRLANTLEHLGFLIRDEESGEYRVGAAALKLGWTYLTGLELPEIAYPFLSDLRYRTGASVHMSVREGTEVVYVSRLAAQAALSSNIRVGSRLPAHASTMGRAMLQDLEDEDLFELYRGTRELAPFSLDTPPNVVALRDLLLKDARNDGVVVSRGYYEKGVVSVAAPIRDGSDRVVAAVNITASADKFPDDVLNRMVKDDVLRCAARISAAIGHDPDSHKPHAGMQLALPDTALADPRYDPVGGEQGHPEYQTRE
tara:strand:+ start:444 stop:1355 length:912 start_codon:yes stop_codon:yes gene_type:complete